MRLLVGVALATALGLASAAPAAHACSCMVITPQVALDQCTHVFLAVVIKVTRQPMIRLGDSYRDDEVLVSLRQLASWKGVHSDTVTVRTGTRGGDCGVEFVERGVYLVYGRRREDGRLYAWICDRTSPISRAREDSLALGAPGFDRLEGRKWSSFLPPESCPVHVGSPIRVAHEWIAILTPDARRDYPSWVEREAPFAGIPLAAPGARGGDVGYAYICPRCHEAARVWIGVSMEQSTGPEPSAGLPRIESYAGHRSEAEYRRLYPRGNFALQYGDGRQRYDSIDGRFDREFGAVRDTGMKFELGLAELDRIYEATVTAQLFDLAAPHPPYPVAIAEASVRVDRAQVLFVRCGVETRQFRWYEARAPRSPAADSGWGRLTGVDREVRRVLASRPEVLALTPIPADLDDSLRDVRSHR